MKKQNRCLIVFKELQAAVTKTPQQQARYFKTGSGEYAHLERFLGVRTPDLRTLMPAFYDLSFEELSELLSSPFNEVRLFALLILVHQYQKGRETAYDFYLQNLSGVNNWNLVDSSAAYIVGHYLFKRDRAILYECVQSSNLWERRIAIVATHYFIRQGDTADTLKLAEMLFQDPEDLMHKAAGWMLREIGNRNQKTLCDFLNKHAPCMPRTMLRYAIERLDVERRQEYLSKK